MTFWRGEEFWITGYDVERKGGAVLTKCPACSDFIDKGSRVAIIRWVDFDVDPEAWTIMHPTCAEQHPVNVHNIRAKKAKKYRTAKEVREEEALAIITERTKRGLYTWVAYHPDKPRGHRWSYKVPVND